jgi:hypothetical protein
VRRPLIVFESDEQRQGRYRANGRLFLRRRRKISLRLRPNNFRKDEVLPRGKARLCLPLVGPNTSVRRVLKAPATISRLSRASHELHPTQIAAWKREAIEKLANVFDGSRQMVRHLRRSGWCVGRHRVRRLTTKMGLVPIYQHPKTSEPHPRHLVYRYLIRHLTIERPNHVWCADLTYFRGAAFAIWSRSWTGQAAVDRVARTWASRVCPKAELSPSAIGCRVLFNELGPYDVVSFKP